MLPDRVSNPGPLTYESGALPIALRGPALNANKRNQMKYHGTRLLFLPSSSDSCPQVFLNMSVRNM